MLNRTYYAFNNTYSLERLGIQLKTYCKNINIEEPSAIMPFVLECLGKRGSKPANWRRRDFSKLIEKYTKYTQKDLLAASLESNCIPPVEVAQDLAIEVSNRIKTRNLDLPPVVFFKRIDGISGKTREISNESAMQRIMDYVAIGALDPLLKAKIMPHQYASIKGKGQLAGKRAIERWIRRNKDFKYFSKLDIEKCFPSISHEIAMKYLKRDIHKNKTLLWFIEALLDTYKKKNDLGEYVECGLIIGTLLSQWLCNYVLSYFYRYILSIKKNRNKRDGTVKVTRKINHILFYMDDVLITSPREADLKSAIRDCIRWAKSELGLTIHDNWFIYYAPDSKIDMMGYVVSFKCTTIRPRIFKRARRQYLRAWRDMKHNKFLSLKRSRLVVCYAGYFIHSDSEKFKLKYHFNEVFEKAKESISYWSRVKRYYEAANVL